MMDQLDIFLAGLKKDMKIKGITQVDLAKAIGVNAGTINNILNGKCGTIGNIKLVINYINNHPDKKK